MPAGKSNKLQNHINYRIRVTMNDTRSFVGTFKAYDKHMNIVLADCEEFRRIKPRKGAAEREEKRVLGFVLLRGENVVNINVEGPPPNEDIMPKIPLPGNVLPGMGMGRAMGRGMPAVPPVMSAPPGLQGPMAGVGAPSAQQMTPGAHGGMMMPPGMRLPPGMMPPGMAPPGGMLPPPGMQMAGMPPGMARAGVNVPPPPGMAPRGAMPPPGMPPRPQ